MAILTPLFFVFRNYKQISAKVTAALFFNIALSTLFFVVRKTPGICEVLPSTENTPCDFDWREMEAFMFLSCIIVIRNRSALSWYQTYSTALQFAKLTSAYLFWRMNIYFGLFYMILCVIRLYFLPDDRIKLPDSVEYLNDLQDCSKGYWLICLYSTWSPQCQKVAPVFSELSRQYSCEGFKFGKIDIGRHDDIAKKFKIRTDSMSQQLPTIVLMQDGAGLQKRPVVQTNGKLQKFHFTEENIVQSFHLNQVYNEVTKGKKPEDKKKD